MKKALTGAVLAAILSLSGCSRDPQKLLETGNRYFEDGKYREAALIYQRAVQGDRRFGEAYYRLGLAEYQLGRYLPAFRALLRAMEFQPDNSDAFERLTDIYLASYDANDQNARQLVADLKDITSRAEENGIDEFLVLRVRGFIALLEEREDDAIELLRQASELRPSDKRIMLALAESYAKLALYEDAERELRRAVEDDPRFGMGYEALYALYARQSRWEDAEQVMLEASRKMPDVNTAWLQLATHYHIRRNAQKRDEAISYLTGNPDVFPNGYREAGEFYMRVGEFQMAAAAFQKGAGAHPDQRNVYRLGTAQAKAMSGDVAEALLQVEQILQEEPDNPSARMLRGSLRVSSGDRAAASESIKELETLLPEMPQNPVLNYSLGRAYLAMGQVEPARIQFTEAIRKRPSYVLPRLALGRIHLARNEPAVALREADAALADSPNNQSARLLRASALIPLGKYDEARRELSSLSELVYAQREVQYLEALLSVAEGNYKEAEGILAGLYKSAPQDRRAAVSLAQLYVSQRRYDVARQVLEPRPDAGPEAADLRLMQARVSVAARDYSGAVQDYQQVLTLRPNDVNVLVELGVSRYYVGDLSGAEAEFRRAREVEPKNPSPALRLAMLLGEMGRREETNELLEEVVTLAPDDPVALNNLAYSLSASAETLDRALVLAQRANDRAPNTPTILDTLGWVYLKRNQSDDAVRVYQNLVSIDPSRATWRYHLGMALYQKGAMQAARVELERALTQAPGEQEAAEIRELLSRIS